MLPPRVINAALLNIHIVECKLEWIHMVPTPVTPQKNLERDTFRYGELNPQAAMHYHSIHVRSCSVNHYTIPDNDSISPSEIY